MSVHVKNLKNTTGRTPSDGRSSWKDFWEKAMFKYPTHQVMIRNDAIYCLTFIESYDVDDIEDIDN